MSAGGATSGLASLAPTATAAARTDGESDDDRERKRRKRLTVLLDFLGFGDDASKP